MICPRCLLRTTARREFPLTTSSRSFSHSSSTSQATPVTAQTATSTNPRPAGGHPAATSTSAAPPFSSPRTPHPSRQDLPIKRNQKTTAAKLPQSSVPAGTVLKGLNFMKGKQDPVAGEDGEYPAWLWRVLEKGGGGEDGAEGKGVSEGDLFAKSKKQRQKAAKALRKQQALNPEGLAPKIPVYEQSVDLPAGDGTVEGALEAGEARHGLNKAMRDMRRKKIKEDNFLRGMG